MRTEIREYLMANRATEQIGELTDGDSLLERGVIDSMTMVDLIAHLERTYDVSIGEDDMTPENFDSIEAIAVFIERTRGDNPSSSSSSPSTG